MSATRSEIRDGMQIDWDVSIKMDDGLVLKADVFRPIENGKYPVIITYGPYAKGLSFQEGYPGAWNIMIAARSGCSVWLDEQVPELGSCSIPRNGFRRAMLVVRVDSRGCGRSPGFVDCFSPRETEDFYQCIEWAAVQPWSNGKVGINGISYYAMNQWQVASKQPPHLAAMCAWEGAADWYRDSTHHGGMVSTFWAAWYDVQVKSVQYGLGERGPRSVVTGELVCGDETFSDKQLAAEPLRFWR